MTFCNVAHLKRSQKFITNDFCKIDIINNILYFYEYHFLLLLEYMTKYYYDKHQMNDREMKTGIHLQ